MPDDLPQLPHARLDPAAFAANVLLLPVVVGLAAFVALPAALCYMLVWWWRPDAPSGLAARPMLPPPSRQSRVPPDVTGEPSESTGGTAPPAAARPKAARYTPAVRGALQPIGVTTELGAFHQTLTLQV